MIDAHAHCAWPQILADAEVGEVALLKATGLEHIVLIGNPGEIARPAGSHGDFIWPVAQIDLARASYRNLATYLPGKFRGVKFISPEEPYSARRYWPLYDFCADRKLPAIFHTGYLGLYGPDSLRTRMGDMHPAELDYIARNWPELKIVMAHFGNPWWDEAFKVLWANPNIYADLSGGSCYRRDLGAWKQLLAPNGEPCAAVIGRLLYGTDKTVGRDYSRRAPDYLCFYNFLLAALGVSWETRGAIMDGNARALFGKVNP